MGDGSGDGAGVEADGGVARWPVVVEDVHGDFDPRARLRLAERLSDDPVHLLLQVRPQLHPSSFAFAIARAAAASESLTDALLTP